jgi:tRNA threonylcarbamoyladenosine biosynthesis protein TsaE
MTLNIITSNAAETKALGKKLGTLLKAGDCVLLAGELGAGKTTFTQGLASALKIKGDVTSPTFVIAREHKSLTDGPNLVHVDAYRLSTLAEISQLDLVTDIETAILVVEWGKGLVNDLVAEPIQITIDHNDDDDDENKREFTINATTAILEGLS